MDDGTIVNLLVDEEQHQVLKQLTSTLPDVILNDRQICDFELLVTGVFSPLTGFMTRMDYESVLDRMHLSNGNIWPMPVCLDIHDTLGQALEVGQSVVLRDPEGFLLGIMTLEDIWPVDREKRPWPSMVPGIPPIPALPIFSASAAAIISAVRSRQ